MSVTATVSEIVADVRERGDVALREWALRFDGVEPALAEPADGLPEEEVLMLAGRVRRWHELQRPADISLEVEPGVLLERRWLPQRTVGIYVPRGLVSTLVMCAVPARAGPPTTAPRRDPPRFSSTCWPGACSSPRCSRPSGACSGSAGSAKGPTGSCRCPSWASSCGPSSPATGAAAAPRRSLPIA
jgi:hypothetical protein